MYTLEMNLNYIIVNISKEPGQLYASDSQPFSSSTMSNSGRLKNDTMQGGEFSVNQ